MLRCWLAVLAILIVAGGASAAEIRLTGVLIKLIEVADVPAQETGVLIDIEAGEGARVKEGDILAKTLDIDARLLVQKYQRELDVANKQASNQTKVLSAQAALRVAQADVKRAKESRMRVGNSVSEAELDRLELAATQADLAVQQAAHEVEIAKLEAALKSSELEIAQRTLARHHISAPFAGVVAEVYRKRGEWVQPGEKTLRLVRTDRLKAEAFVPLDKARQISPGNAVVLSTEDGASYAGKLTFLSPEADPFNGQVRMVAEIENPKGTLRPGQKGTLTIHTTP
jgi:macrolide-specific efflux system membrane fusion protein